jgi:NAD(P)-dependent dehydrogenase (short-subunit alcohol dehydrogenase family)
VVNFVRDDESAREDVQTITNAGSRALAIRADVSEETQLQAMFAEMFKESGTIDILVNNAGLHLARTDARLRIVPGLMVPLPVFSQFRRPVRHFAFLVGCHIVEVRNVYNGVDQAPCTRQFGPCWPDAS